jgi:RNA polymerase-interacting CarD/CdnL/TRCF family regulator
MDFAEGALVVYPGQGLCRVVGTQQIAGKEFLMLEQTTGGGMKLGVPLNLAATMLKKPMPRDEAEALFARLLSTDFEPDFRAWPYRYRDATKAMARGPASARVEQLLRLYRTPHKLSFGEAKMVGAFEDVVLSELAVSMQTSSDSLKEQLSAVHPVLRGEVPDRPPAEEFTRPRPPPPFELPLHEFLGTFRSDGTLVVAEPGATLSSADQPPEEDVRHNAHVKVKPGNYLAFLRTDEPKDDNEAENEDVERGGAKKKGGALIAVHEDFANKLLTLTLSAFDLVGVIVEGGRIAMLDESVRTDQNFIDEMEFPLFSEGLILDRGVMATTGGDGVFPVAIARPLGETTFVMVAF